MHRRLDRPSLEFSRRRLLSLPARADMTVEHEPRSLIRAQALVREIHLDVFIRELNRDFFMIPRDQWLHSVITPGNGRARVF